MQDRFPDQLLQNIKSNYSQLKKLLREMNSHWYYEDLVYRFYHGSFKVYRQQHETRKIVEALEKLAPEGFIFCSSFQDLMKKGAGNKQWKLSHNRNWEKHTRIFLEAFFHAKYFLEMAVKYGKILDKAPDIMPSGWAALLSLYQNVGIRNKTVGSKRLYKKQFNNKTNRQQKKKSAINLFFL